MKPYGLPTHDEIDGFSRNILCLQERKTNKAIMLSRSALLKNY